MDEKPKISLRHAVDLLYAGHEMARKMGQVEKLRERAPELQAILQELAERLDALGSNGARTLRSDPRLAAAADRLHVGDIFHAEQETKRRLGEEALVWFDLPATLEELDAIAERLAELGCDGFAVLRADAQLAAAITYYDDWKAQRLHAEQGGGGVLSFGICGSPLLDQNRANEKIMHRMLSRRRPIRLELRQGQLAVSCGTLAFAIPATYEAEGVQLVSRGFLSLLLDALQHDEWLQCEIRPDVYQINGMAFRPSSPA